VSSTVISIAARSPFSDCLETSFGQWMQVAACEWSWIEKDRRSDILVRLKEESLSHKLVHHSAAD
jgi:hypothetical protein